MTDNKQDLVAGYGLLAAVTSDIGQGYRILCKALPELAVMGLASDAEKLEAALVTIQAIGLRCKAEVFRMMEEIAK